MIVEVVYASPSQQIVLELELTAGATVAEALSRAAADPRLTEALAQTSEIGIFGQRCSPQQTLENGDRVEIYRPLRVDAKTARRLRAEQQRRQDGSS